MGMLPRFLFRMKRFEYQAWCTFEISNCITADHPSYPFCYCTCNFLLLIPHLLSSCILRATLFTFPLSPTFYSLPPIISLSFLVFLPAVSFRPRERCGGITSSLLMFLHCGKNRKQDQFSGFTSCHPMTRFSSFP